MPVTTLDPRTALVVIDLQQGIKAFAPAETFAEVVKKAADLADAFRARNLPVVLVNVTGGAPGRNEDPPRTWAFGDDFADLLPELNQQPSDHVVTKKTWGAFANTGLEAWLKGQGVTQIVLCGVATSIGVESTARAAYDYGFNLTLAVDAMTDRNADAHADVITRVFPRLGETGKTQDIIALLK
jgi:nicotinamidase-related amidase